MDDPQRISVYPLVLLVISFLILWLLAWIAATRFHVLRRLMREEHVEFNVVQGATLTLLALIIGFSFSMALTRYDQRKNLEEEEANAIGTEYLRLDFLPDADAARARQLLVEYVGQRVLFYTTREENDLAQIDQRTSKLQNEMWSIVQKAAAAQPTPPMAVAVMGMNDVLNSQGYTLAAWRNRIPAAAWWLMFAIAACATMLVGIGLLKPESGRRLLPLLPLVIAIAFCLIADIDSPRHGMIRVVPVNLLSLPASLQTPPAK